MSDQKLDNVLARKLRAREKPELPSGNSVGKALSTAFAKVGEDIGGMVSAVASSTEDTVGHDDLTAAAVETSLICVLARENAALGMVVADMNVVASVLEYLTTDRVTSHPPDERAPTRTDAAVVGGFIDQFLRSFDKELAFLEAPPDFTGFRCARSLPDARAIRMALEEMPYKKINLGVDLGENGRSGTIALYFPLEAPRASRSPDEEASWSARWQRNAVQLPTEVEATLHRFLMPLADILELEPGTLLRIPESQIMSVSLEGANKRIVARGKLGRIGEKRAIKVQLNGQAEAPPAVIDLETDLSGTATTPSAMETGLPNLVGLHEAEAAEDDASAVLTVPGDGLEGDPAGDFPALDDLPPLGDMPPLENI